MKHVACAIAAVAAAASAAPAQAQILEEVRIGYAAHNLLDEEDKEEGHSASGEVVFASPELLNVLGGPRPYLMASLHTDKGANWAGFGLYWRIGGERWALEPGFGYVIHDGAIDNPYPDGSPAAAYFGANNVLFGSRDLFRSTLAIERRFGERFAVQVFAEHLSHGQIIGSGRNQGIENAGVRAAFRFADD